MTAPVDVNRIRDFIENAATVSVIRATPHARELATRTASSPSLGKDVITIKLELDPEDADMLLRFIGGRS